MFFDIEKEVDRGILSESLKTSETESANITAISSGKGLLAIGDSVGTNITFYFKEIQFKQFLLYFSQVGFICWIGA